MKGKHLLFYDGSCGLCDHIVQWLLLHDRKACFLFAPLQGTTAELYLPPPLKEGDSLVLIENYRSPSRRILTSGKGALRILWLLGAPWSIGGMLSFLPAIFFDGAYRFVAKRRHRFFSDRCILPNPSFSDRFLP